MPDPSSSSPTSGLRRRTALGGLLALGAVTAGCTSGQRTHRPAPSPLPPVETDPDVALAATVLAAEQEVLDLVEATLRRHHRLRHLLRTTREVHRAHVALLTDAVPKGAASSSGSPSPVATPAEETRKAVVALARAEDRLVLVDKRSAFSAESGAFARVLASMAAASSQQAVLLRDHAAARTGARR